MSRTLIEELEVAAKGDAHEYLPGVIAFSLDQMAAKNLIESSWWERIKRALLERDLYAAKIAAAHKTIGGSKDGDPKP